MIESEELEVVIPCWQLSLKSLHGSRKDPATGTASKEPSFLDLFKKVPLLRARVLEGGTKGIEFAKAQLLQEHSYCQT